MISKIVTFLYALVGLLEKLANKRERKEAQDERDHLEDNPTEWYNQHFGGMRESKQADNANKADSNRDTKE